MKRILIASAVALAAGGQALAADLPPPMAPPPRAPAVYYPPPPVYNWTGIYVGGNVGAGWNSTGSISDTPGTFGSTFGTTTSTSFLGGGQIGVNYEFGGGVVVGAEAMFDWLPNTSNTINVTGAGNAAGLTGTATINNRWLTTATGKLGYAWDRVLLYGKGGGAWVGNSNPSFTVTNVGVAPFSNTSNNNFGWTAGLGVEYAFWGNWSARAEWDYVRLQNQSFTVAGAAAVPPATSFNTDVISVNNRSINMVTAGLNYKFGGGWW